MTDRKLKRNSNFELMRIVSMFMIVVWHGLQHTNMIYQSSGTLSLVSTFLYIIMSVHVNSFVLLTGYFQYNKIMKPKKVINLLGQTWFYNIMFVVLTIIFGVSTLSGLEIIENTSILSINNYWFINYYIVLYLLTPFLNKFIEAANRKEHKKVILLMFLCLSVLPFITRQRMIANNGLTIISFLFLYLVGAYLGKYPIKESYHFRNISNNKKQLLFLILFFFFGFVNFINYQFGNILLDSGNSIIQSVGQTITTGIIGFSSPFVVLASICYLLFFVTLHFKSKFINRIAGLTFGVYLVHENSYVFNNLYSRVFSPITEYTGCRVLLKILFVAVILFLIGMIVEFIRQRITILLLKIPFIKKLKFKLSSYVKDF